MEDCCGSSLFTAEGTTASFDEVAGIMGTESGKEVRVRSIALEKFKRELLKTEMTDHDVARY